MDLSKNPYEKEVFFSLRNASNPEYSEGNEEKDKPIEECKDSFTGDDCEDKDKPTKEMPDTEKAPPKTDKPIEEDDDVGKNKLSYSGSGGGGYSSGKKGEPSEKGKEGKNKDFSFAITGYKYDVKHIAISGVGAVIGLLLASTKPATTKIGFTLLGLIAGLTTSIKLFKPEKI